MSDDADWFERAIGEDADDENADGEDEPAPDAEGQDGSDSHDTHGGSDGHDADDGRDGSDDRDADDGRDGSDDRDADDGRDESDDHDEPESWGPNSTLEPTVDDVDADPEDESGSVDPDVRDGAGRDSSVTDRDRGTSAGVRSDRSGEDRRGRVSTDSDTTDDGGSPFDEDFASALQDAPDPSVEGPGSGGAEAGGSSPFGGDRGDSFGGEGSTDPFGSEDAGNDFGFDDFDDDFGGAPGGFDPDAGAFESDLPRIDIGIDGLDDMILGGVPRRSLMVAIGSAGTGKTTFGLQFLRHGLENGEDAVYITLEESQQRIVDTADEKGWGFEEYIEEDRLVVVDIDPIEMANSLDSIQNELPDLIEEFGADRLVLDSVSLLEMMYESAPRRRSQVFGFSRSLKNAGITTLLTSEASEDNPYTSRFGIVEYLADAVFVLQYVRPSDFRETRLAIEIQKIRDANHSRETKPYELTAEGISVYRQANIF
ncbi:KaiC domain-containing protein [Halobellus clavatus]|uniref:KaiC domain-containing protein n=1 Tax=Halobellus clavatus TaxID=660517 RepID=UPI000B7E178A|nr:KaiC domain-containing protein [Halobellus clavatus]